MKNCRRFNILALDFDNSAASPQEILEYAKELDLMPNFYYYTFSQKTELITDSMDFTITENCQKETKDNFNFRFVWVLDKPIKVSNDTKTNNFNIIINFLLTAFKQFIPDKSCKDANRIFFGGISSKLINETPVPAERFVNILIDELNFDKVHLTRNVKRIGFTELQAQSKTAINCSLDEFKKLIKMNKTLDEIINVKSHVPYDKRLFYYDILQSFKNPAVKKYIAEQLQKFDETYDSHTL